MRRDKGAVFSSVLTGSFLLSFFLIGASVHAQQKAAPRALAYDVARETTIQGTVLSFAETSATPPIGAQMTLQTSNGTEVRVHLGSAAFLRANHFSLVAGDVVTVTGVNVGLRQGSIFAARVIQKGSQSLALRSPTGAPLWFAGVRPQGGATSLQQGGPR